MLDVADCFALLYPTRRRRKVKAKRTPGTNISNSNNSTAVNSSNVENKVGNPTKSPTSKTLRSPKKHAGDSNKTSTGAKHSNNNPNTMSTTPYPEDLNHTSANNRNGSITRKRSKTNDSSNDIQPKSDNNEHSNSSNGSTSSGTITNQGSSPKTVELTNDTSSKTKGGTTSKPDVNSAATTEVTKGEDGVANRDGGTGTKRGTEEAGDGSKDGDRDDDDDEEIKESDYASNIYNAMTRLLNGSKLKFFMPLHETVTTPKPKTWKNTRKSMLPVTP